MSYRKITVDGKTYEYSIGKTHTKIRGVKAWKNEEIGAVRVMERQRRWDYPDASLQVTPNDVAQFIKTKAFKSVETRL